MNNKVIKALFEFENFLIKNGDKSMKCSDILRIFVEMVLSEMTNKKEENKTK